MAKSNPQFTKIVANDSHVALSWTSKKKTASQAEEIHGHELTCEERPLPSFDKALQAFKPHLLQIIGAPQDWSEKTIIRGVTLKKEEGGARGIVITAIRHCPHGSAPIALNTPYLREQVDETKEGGSNFFLPGMAESIDEICAAASAYLSGDRAQGELFGDEEKEDKKKRGKGGEPELVGDIADRIAKGAKGREPAGARS